MFGMEKDAGRAHVFIVDDMEINRIVLGEIISHMGCAPVLFESGEKALEELAGRWKSGGKKPQLILTDISMPGMDGYEFCRILKGHENTKNIPIIFISAYNESKDIVEGFSHGCEDYITKPFIAEEVQARVGLHLKLYAVTRELREMNRHLQASVREQLRQMELEKKNFLRVLAGIAARSAGYDEAVMERLKDNCRTLTQGMQLSPLFEEKISDTYIDTIELAAPLCDIGNVGISREILQKKGALTKEEENILQSHTLIGAEILEEIRGSGDYNDFLTIAGEIAGCHHESWDGSGYPKGLKGEEIPLSARIVSLMDRYCALTGEKNLSAAEALSVLEKEAGVRFDPDIYRICCKIFRQLR